MMLVLPCTLKLHCRPFSHFHHMLFFFHHYAPSESPQLIRKLYDDENTDYPNLLNHRDWLSQPQVIKIFHTLKNPNFALPLLHQLSQRKDYNPNESLYSTVLNKLSIAKDFDGVDNLMKTIKKERKCRLSDAFFRDVIKIYGHSAGRVDKAVETLFDMPNYKCWPGVVTFNCVLNMLVSGKKFELVHEVYVKGCELGVEIDACCLNILIKGLCECGKVDEAFKVLDEFEKQKCRPNVRTFSTIMHGLCECDRVDEALGLLERMEMEEGLEVDAIVFNILISGLRKRGRFDEGIVFFHEMMVKGCHPNPGTYQEVLYCLLDAKRFSEAKRFMESMIEKGVNPSFESYKTLIQGFCSKNLVEDAEWTMRVMVGSGFVPKMGLWKQIVRCLRRGRRDIICDSVSWEELICY